MIRNYIKRCIVEILQHTHFLNVYDKKKDEFKMPDNIKIFIQNTIQTIQWNESAKDISIL